MKGEGKLRPAILEGHDAIAIGEGGTGGEGLCGVGEIVAICPPVVIIEKGDAVPRGGRYTEIAGGNRPAPGIVENFDAGMHVAHRLGGTLAIVDDDDFVCRMGLRQNAGDRLAEEVMAAACGDDDGDCAHAGDMDMVAQ